jgi:hypothetical protein
MTPHDATKAPSNGQSRTHEGELREREVSVKEREVAVREAELQLKRAEQSAGRGWRSPLVIAIFGATLAGVSNAYVAKENGKNQIALEDGRAEQARILEMIKTGKIEAAADNLQFLLEAGLVTNADRAERLKSYLSRRKEGEGPVLPPQVAGVAGPLTFCDGKKRCSGEPVACFLAGDDTDTESMAGTLVSPGVLQGVGISGAVFWIDTPWKNEACGTSGDHEWVVSYGSCGKGASFASGIGTGLKRCKAVLVRTP